MQIKYKNIMRMSLYISVGMNFKQMIKDISFWAIYTISYIIYST